jgi:very-short-patch-repair endonuclease
MYFQLTQAFPSGVVLAQVAFSALITSKDRATRNRFDRKVADFVICTKAFQVAAVIELDDSSHRGREVQDSKRDRLLESAGYRVLRYKTIPDIDKLRIDVAGTAQTKAA